MADHKFKIGQRVFHHPRLTVVAVGLIR